MHLPPTDWLETLERARSIAVIAHEKPDGDALGAALGLARIWRARGRTARTVGFQPLAPRYTFLPTADELEAPSEEWLAGVDAVVSLDAATAERLGDFAAAARGRVPLLNLDHHDDNTRFGDNDWVDPTASSSGEMVLRLARVQGWPLPLPAAEALWVAIVTDTGRFAYEKTSAETLRLAADLIDAGVRPDLLEERIYQSLTWKEHSLRLRALEHLRLFAGGRIAALYLTRGDLRDLACGPQHAEEIVNLGRQLLGVEGALFLMEDMVEERTKLSVRTKGAFNAQALCARFGGGGHPRAAGCHLPGLLPATLETAIAEAESLWLLDGEAPALEV